MQQLNNINYEENNEMSSKKDILEADLYIDAIVCNMKRDFNMLCKNQKRKILFKNEYWLGYKLDNYK